VGIVGTDAVGKKLRHQLEEQGAEVFSALRMDVKPLPVEFDFTALEQTSSWVVFTSANGVACFFRELRNRNMDLRCLSKCRFAVIGPGTGEALARYGFRWDLCPETYTTEALAKALMKTGEREVPVYLMRSARGNPLLRECLQEHFDLEDVALYDVAPDGLSPKGLLERTDYLVFSSAGGAALFLERYGRIPEGAKCVCIGEMTAKAIRGVPEERILVAEKAVTESLVHAILKDQNRL
jgi:uroporphyrinogen III methyltransferase/synthase